MPVQDFVQHILHLNDLIDYTPISNPINNPGIQKPKYNNTKLSRIVQNECSTRQKKAQVQAILHHLSLLAQTRYYTSLKNVEQSNKVTMTKKLTTTKYLAPLLKQTSKIQPKTKDNPTIENTDQKSVKFTENAVTQQVNAR